MYNFVWTMNAGPRVMLMFCCMEGLAGDTSTSTLERLILPDRRWQAEMYGMILWKGQEELGVTSTARCEQMT